MNPLMIKNARKGLVASVRRRSKKLRRAWSQMHDAMSEVRLSREHARRLSELCGGRSGTSGLILKALVEEKLVLDTAAAYEAYQDAEELLRLLGGDS